MDAKEYLQQVEDKEAEIRNLRRDKESVREMLFSLGGSGEGERVQSSRNTDKFGTLYGRIDEMEREIDRKITELLIFKMKVSREIDEIKDRRYITILNCRYIHFMPWEKIASEAFDVPYTMKHILKLHGQALTRFQEIHSGMLEIVQK